MIGQPGGFPARTLATALVVACGLAVGVSAAGRGASAGEPAAATVKNGPPPDAAAVRAAGYVGDDTCATCHEAEAKSLGSTMHSKAANPRTPAATGQACETCHGPGREHAESGGDRTKIKRFTAMPARDVTATCETCHDRGTHANWDGSPHDSRNMSCVTCHSVHSPKSPTAQLKKASQIETCATCHRAQAMKVARTQHMPVTEGKMTCTTCHNPHGSTNVKQLKAGNSVSELCVSCHTEKRGPFLWEHAPVAEGGCVSCHDPHGSSNDRLLVAKVPMLCQRCHVTTRHPATLYSGANILAAGGSPSNRIYGRGCVNCHQQIHGSNSPSGNAFLR